MRAMFAAIGLALLAAACGPSMSDIEDAAADGASEVAVEAVEASEVVQALESRLGELEAEEFQSRIDDLEAQIADLEARIEYLEGG